MPIAKVWAEVFRAQIQNGRRQPSSKVLIVKILCLQRFNEDALWVLYVKEYIYILFGDSGQQLTLSLHSEWPRRTFCTQLFGNWLKVVQNTISGVIELKESIFDVILMIWLNILPCIQFLKWQRWPFWIYQWWLIHIVWGNFLFNFVIFVMFQSLL